MIILIIQLRKCVLRPKLYRSRFFIKNSQYCLIFWFWNQNFIFSKGCVVIIKLFSFSMSYFHFVLGNFINGTIEIFSEQPVLSNVLVINNLINLHKLNLLRLPNIIKHRLVFRSNNVILFIAIFGSKHDPLEISETNFVVIWHEKSIACAG